MSRTHLRGWDYVTTPCTLGHGDSLRLDPGITLEMLQRVPAVTFTGGRARLHNEGEITTYGEHCIAGTLTGPFDIRIVNELSLRNKSGVAGADIVLDSAEGTTGTLRIINSGGSLGPSDPAGIHGGIDLSALHADHVVLINTGKIGLGIFGTTAYAGGFGADAIINHGDIRGELTLGAGNDRLVNTGFIMDTIDLGAGDDVLCDTGSSWHVYGGEGDDRISLGYENNWVWGGAGRDIMNGGLGGDSYVFDALSDSGADRAHADVIRGYDKPTGDYIVLTNIDANATVDGNQAFTFVGEAAFSGSAGELRCQITHQGAVLYADVNGDAQSDFALVIQGAVTQPTDLALAL